MKQLYKAQKFDECLKDYMKCNISDMEHPKLCFAMNEAMGDLILNDCRTGISLVQFTNVKTWKKSRAGIRYRPPREKGGGIFLNFCPWCGADLTAHHNKTGEEVETA